MIIPLRLLRRPLSGLFLPPCLLVALVCANLDDVADLKHMAESARETLPAVVADISASCDRQNLLLNDLPADERPPELKPQDCKPYHDIADHVTKDQDVLVEYFDSLGRVASNMPLSYDQNIDTNVATIGGLSHLSQATIAASGAAQKITRILADAATRAYRERKVNALVNRSDDAIQELTTDLSKVVVTDYRGILSNESEIMDIYYSSSIAAAGKSERLALILVQRQYNDESRTLRSRKDAALAYGKMMANLASLHSKLKAESTKKAGLRTIAQQIAPEVTNLRDAISELKAEMK